MRTRTRRRIALPLIRAEQASPRRHNTGGKGNMRYDARPDVTLFGHCRRILDTFDGR